MKLAGEVRHMGKARVNKFCSPLSYLKLNIATAWALRQLRGPSTGNQVGPG